MIVASLIIVGAYFFPIWQITLEAPQFPEGLQMHIYANKIGGSNPNILQNINILNHYIGMKKITPDAIPELKIIPIVLGALIVLGLVVAFIGKRWLMITWLILFLLLGAAGIYDFYLWLYDYGHNLDPQAPIKIPGMVYQPPLIGSKWLLNFKSISFPSYGSIFIGLSILIATVVILYDRFFSKR